MSVPASTAQTDTQAAPPGSNGQGASQNGVPAPDASSGLASPVLAPPSQEPDSPVRDFIRDAFRPRVMSEPTVNTGQTDVVKEGEAKTGAETASQQAKTGDGPRTEPVQPPPGHLLLSESDLERRVQSETDRRESRRRDDAARKAEAELRDKDPWAYAKLMREKAESQGSEEQINTLAAARGNEWVADYDRKVLNPLVALVKDSEAKAAVIANIPQGIDGRAHVAGQMLGLYEKQIREETMSDARRTLAEDQVFVKEILARYGGQRFEPDVVSAVGTPAAQRVDPDTQMNGFMRSRR